MNSILYDINKQKHIKREKLPSNIGNAVIAAITAQFGVDVFFSFFFTDNNVLEDDLKISEIPTYYAALSSGLIIGIISLFMDRLATIAIATLFFSITYNYINYLINEEEFDVDTTDYVNDVLATIIIVYLFDPKSHFDYYNHYNERHCISKDKIDSDRTTLDIVLIIIITNSYFYIRDHFNDTDTPATTSSIVATDD